MERLNELAFYTLAGAPRTPRELIAEVVQAEVSESVGSKLDLRRRRPQHSLHPLWAEVRQESQQKSALLSEVGVEPTSS